MGGRARGLGSEGERCRGTRPRARGAWPRTVRRARARWRPDFFVPLCGRRGRITRIIIRGFVAGAWIELGLIVRLAELGRSSKTSHF